MKLLLLGGGGAMAGFALEKLLDDDVFEEIVIADYSEEAAKAAVACFKSDKLTPVQIDVHDKERLVELMNNSDVVANCTGPFYLLLEPVAEAFFESDCKKYVDFCDDMEAIEKIQTKDNDKKCKELDKTMIIGLGGSPGLIPVIIMYGASLMDKPETVQLSMLMDESEEGGAAVWDHMFENFWGDIATYENGEIRILQGLTEPEDFTFPEDIFSGIGTQTLYDLGHPEVFTIPQAIPEIQNVKIKCAFYPTESMNFILEMNNQGFLDTEKVVVDGVEVSPRSVFLKQMENTVMNPDYPGGFQPKARDLSKDYGTGSVIDVLGHQDNGKKVQYRLSYQMDMGSATGYPLAAGARMLAQNAITSKGITIPEFAIEDRKAFIDEIFESIEKLGHEVKVSSYVKYED